MIRDVIDVRESLEILWELNTPLELNKMFRYFGEFARTTRIMLLEHSPFEESSYAVSEGGDCSFPGPSGKLLLLIMGVGLVLWGGHDSPGRLTSKTTRRPGKPHPSYPESDAQRRRTVYKF